jgi:hypothetical protein
VDAKRASSASFISYATAKKEEKKAFKVALEKAFTFEKKHVEVSSTEDSRRERSSTANRSPLTSSPGQLTPSTSEEKIRSESLFNFYYLVPLFSLNFVDCSTKESHD